MTPNPKIISIGEVLWDLFPNGERFGGAPANFACHAAVLGGQVKMVSAVGDDDRGREALRILDCYEVDTGLTQTIPAAPTCTVGVKVDERGKPRFTIHESSAWDHLTWSDELDTQVAEADAVYFGTLGQRGAASRSAIHRALDAAESAGACRVLDVNLRAPFFSDSLIRESIHRATLLKLSDDELPAVTRACEVPLHGDHATVLRTLLYRFGLDSIVMTRGADGALFVSAEDTFEQPGIPTEVVDTVGAGDAFTAAFVVGLLRGNPVDAVLRDACRTASVVCSQPGAIPNPVQSVT